MCLLVRDAWLPASLWHGFLHAFCHRFVCCLCVVFVLVCLLPFPVLVHRLVRVRVLSCFYYHFWTMWYLNVFVSALHASSGSNISGGFRRDWQSETLEFFLMMLGEPLLPIEMTSHASTMWQFDMLCDVISLSYRHMLLWQRLSITTCVTMQWTCSDDNGHARLLKVLVVSYDCSVWRVVSCPGS